MEFAFVLGHPVKLLILIAVIVLAIVISEQYKKRSASRSEAGGIGPGDETTRPETDEPGA